ncbi:AAA family ATPase [Peribacillus sp. NPDC096448]|uniref:AAA family ATPase n=1 Tax=Peribacillus sp. NPDC096448 TaxID=3364395 RepID=UPI00382B26B7
MLLTQLQVNDWNQFENISINFHPKLTVITGANGSGKSTLIRLIGRIIGWQYNENGIPSSKKFKLRGRFNSGIRSSRLNFDNDTTNTQIGSIKTETGGYKIFVPTHSENAVYNVFWQHEGTTGNLNGLNIPSHRLPYSYKKLNSIPVKPQSKKEAFNHFTNSVKKRFLQNQYYNPQDDDPTLHMKSTMMSLAVFGKGNEHVSSDKEAYDLFLGFVEVLKMLLPPSLGFNNIHIKDGEILLITDTGDFLLDSVSGGIGAIIDLAWQIYMYDEGKSENFIVLIDEAENHLHASMQRSLLPDLIKAFPNAQFIISTHSPFMVNSVQDSSVYALSYNENKLVCSQALDFENKTANAAEILRDVLGVPVTFPIWVEHEIKKVIERYSNTELNAENYIQLKLDLSEYGLSEYLPQALSFMRGGN